MTSRSDDPEEVVAAAFNRRGAWGIRDGIRLVVQQGVGINGLALARRRRA
ncbi:MAG: hypothetical protein ABEL04_05960 [Salinibacter sp.]